MFDNDTMFYECAKMLYLMAVCFLKNVPLIVRLETN